MELLTIFGGPRPEGNTATILGWIEDAVRENGHAVVRINVDGMEIGGCAGCYACMESKNTPGCVLADDAHRVFDAMRSADAILLGTPLYMWGHVGPLKTLLDRCLCLATGYSGPEPHRSLVEGKPTALVVACGGGVADNADAIELVHRRWEQYLKLYSREIWVVPHCTEPEHLGRDVHDHACALASRLLPTRSERSRR